MPWSTFGQTYTIHTVAGSGTCCFSGDGGPATSAQLNDPTGVAVDSAGNLYIADMGNDSIRKVSNGVITTVASGLAGPWGIAVDSAGNLYISGEDNRVRKVSNGVITTVAGNGTGGFGGDNGPATGAQLWGPAGVAVDSAGNLFIADTYNYRIREVSGGTITTVAGGETPGFGGDNGPATSAQLLNPLSVTVDAAGNLYIADRFNNSIRKVSNGVISTVAGSWMSGFSGDNGPATSALLSAPMSVAVDSAGNLYIADHDNNRIRKVSGGLITTVAGGGSFLGDSGPATSALLSGASGVAVDSAGRIYIADTGNNRIRRVSNGVITTVAGNGGFSFFGDNGPATSAQLYHPEGVAVDSGGSLYIADSGNQLVRKVSNGVITAVAGNGTPGFSGDNGPAIDAQLSGPNGVAVDSAGNLYIADSGNFRIRKVSNGVIATVAGGGSFLGDTGPASSAWLWGPEGIAMDSADDFYIADAFNNRIREVSNGVITAVAGDSGFGYFGDNGPAPYAALSGPQGVAVDSAGDLYIADTGNNCIRKVSNGVITTVAGQRDVRLQRGQRPGHQRPGEPALGRGGGLCWQSVRLRHWQQPHPQGLKRGDHDRGGKRDARLQRRRRPSHQRPGEPSRRRRRGLCRQRLLRRPREQPHPCSDAGVSLHLLCRTHFVAGPGLGRQFAHQHPNHRCLSLDSLRPAELGYCFGCILRYRLRLRYSRGLPELWHCTERDDFDCGRLGYRHSASCGSEHSTAIDEQFSVCGPARGKFRSGTDAHSR
jgi:sugar lactone lactonase YvrE